MWLSLCLLLLAVDGLQAQKGIGAPPYRCGFHVDRMDRLEKLVRPELAVTRYLPGDVIASIGASNGFREAMAAVLVDSLTFYLQDIDSLCLNAEEVALVWDYYSRLKGQPLNSSYRLVLGTETATGLPEATFDKVIITASFHHFSDEASMLADIYGKLKPDGRLYIIENVVRKSGQRRRKTCRHPLRSAEDLEAVFRRNGYSVTDVQPLHRWWTKIFVLEKTDGPR